MKQHGDRPFDILRSVVKHIFDSVRQPLTEPGEYHCTYSNKYMHIGEGTNARKTIICMQIPTAQSVSSMETYAYDATCFLTKRTVAFLFFLVFFFFGRFYRMTGRMALGVFYAAVLCYC